MSNIFYPNHIVEINLKSDGINLGIPSLLYIILLIFVWIVIFFFLKLSCFILNKIITLLIRFMI